MRKFLKIAGIILGCIIVVLVLAGLTFHYWFPTALKPIAARFDVKYQTYEKLPDGRFALTGVVRTNASFDLKIARIEGFFPDVWYKQATSSTTNQTNTFLKVDGWRVVIHPAKKPDKPPADAKSTNQSVYAFYKKAEHFSGLLRQWAPKAVFLNGIVNYQNKEYTFPVATWDDSRLEADGVWPISAVPLEIKARFNTNEPFQVSYAMHPLDLRAKVQMWETNGIVASKINAVYKEAVAYINADFPRQGFIPNRATVSAPDFKLPGELLRLKGYQDINGTLTANWFTNRYDINLKAHGDPFQSSSNLPPVDIELVASGNTNQARIETLVSTAPGLELSLSDPIVLNYRGEMLSDRSELKVAADLEKVPMLKLNGRIEGNIVLEKGSRFPLVRLKANGKNISAYQLDAESIGMDAVLNWPQVQKLEFKANFSGGGTLTLNTEGNVDTRELGDTILTASGQFVTNLLPRGVGYQSVTLEARARGPLTNLQHQARIALRGLVTSQTPEMNLEADWQGRQIAIDQFNLLARSGPAGLLARGRVSVTPGATNIQLAELTLKKGDDVYLALADPFQVMLTNSTGGRAFQVQPFAWRGENKELRFGGTFDFPRAGAFQFSATNINPEMFQFFLKRSLSGLELPQLTAAGAWDNGPLFGTMSGSLFVEHKQFKRIGAHLNLELDENGLTLTDFRLQDRSGEIARALGFLPVAVLPLDPENKIHLSRRDALGFTLETLPNEVFWDTLAGLTQVRLTNAAVKLALQGTTRRPVGRLKLEADGVQFLKVKQEIPALGKVDAEVLLNEQMLTIPSFDLRVEDQPLHARASVQLGENFWTQRRQAIVKYLLDHADLQLVADEIQVAPFAKFLPRHLAPQGTLQVNAGLRPGRELAGNIFLQGVETRPISKVGVIQGIEAYLQLHGQTVTISNLQGVLGGEVLRVSGDLDLSETNLASGYPGVNLRIQGVNLPLARNPDVILRSDLDLRVAKGPNGVPVITGEANLRESYLLRDITTLAPGRLAAPERRPPYFSIKQDPIDDWLLNVRVRGENFMRVRSPFFQGQVSVALQVTGTLELPVAVGEAQIGGGGRILFPFAPLEVKQAIVSLTSDNPYQPSIFAVATGRAFGYDIRMEAEGPAAEPVIQFSSVPALTSEQIVLMLTTGQIPRSDFGFSNQEKVSKLAFFLGKSLLSKLNPGKPAEERLVIRSGEDITEQGRQTYSVEYKINKDWSLIGEYDRFGALNADVKWRFFSR